MGKRARTSTAHGRNARTGEKPMDPVEKASASSREASRELVHSIRSHLQTAVLLIKIGELQREGKVTGSYENTKRELRDICSNARTFLASASALGEKDRSQIELELANLESAMSQMP
jgi:hypothetical protein